MFSLEEHQKHAATVPQTKPQPRRSETAGLPRLLRRLALHASELREIQASTLGIHGAARAKPRGTCRDEVGGMRWGGWGVRW